MSWPTWTLFMTAVFLLSATPGPNMLHVMSRSVSLGLRRSLPAMAGCLSGILVLLLAAAAGLVALLRTFPVLFELLRYAGVAYLLWLGIQCWRHAGAGSDGGNGAEAPRLSTAQLFRGGFWVSISNPKSLLFVGAFLPQFIDPARPQLLQWGILIATFAACELFWYAAYGLGGHSLRRWLQRPLLRRNFDRLTGLIFIGFGALLLRFKPQ